MSDSSNVLCLKTEPKPYGVQVEWTWPDGSHWFSRVELQYVREKSIPVVKVIEWPVTGLFISGLKVGEKIHVRMRGLDKEGNGPRWKASDWIEGVASELQSTIDEVLDSIRKSDVFKILSGQCIEKPKSDGQQQVVFDNDQHRAGIIANATSLIEAMNAAYARQEAMMTELASAQAAITESINQAVNDAIANALRPGGVLYAFRTRT